VPAQLPPQQQLLLYRCSVEKITHDLNSTTVLISLLISAEPLTGSYLLINDHGHQADLPPKEGPSLGQLKPLLVSLSV
jgi:hypothetical protein